MISKTYLESVNPMGDWQYFEHDTFCFGIEKPVMECKGRFPADCWNSIIGCHRQMLLCISSSRLDMTEDGHWLRSGFGGSGLASLSFINGCPVTKAIGRLGSTDV